MGPVGAKSAILPRRPFSFANGREEKTELIMRMAPKTRLRSEKEPSRNALQRHFGRNGEPHKSFSGKWIRDVLRPGVLGWRRGEKYLWIGASASVLRRMIGHNVIGKSDVLRDTDAIDVWHSATHRRASRLAERLNDTHRPKYSSTRKRGDMSERTCRGCKEPFTPKRWWQEFHSEACRNKVGRIE